MAEVAHHPSSEEAAGASNANLSKTDDLEDGEFPEPVKPPAADAAATTTSTLATTPAVSRLQELEQLGAGGVYIPPARRRQLEAQQQAQPTATATAASTVSVQRRTWQEQKRVVHGTINRLNASTIKPLIHQLFQNVNLIRLRGVLARSLLQAAVSAPRYSNVYAALVAVINTKLPEVGELIVHRAILAFRRHFARREKTSCLAMALFMGHLFHQAVLHELSMLQLLSLLLDEPTDDSVEVAVPLLQTIGYALLEVSPTGVRAVLERLRALLHEGTINARVQYKVEQLLAQRKTGFRDLPPPIPNELDLVERDEQITFEIGIDEDDIQKEEHLDIFRVDPEYEQNENVWTEIRNEILGLGGSNSDDDDDDGDEETDDDEEEESADEEDDANPELAIVPADTTTTTVAVQDLSESDLIHLRRTIYLTIMSSATFEECTHKLTKVNIPPGREEELINMLIECCSQERTFLRYYGLISARFCLLDDRWKQAFMESFATQYNTIHRLETNKLRNVAKLFAHLLHSDSIPWSVLTNIHLNEQETTSSSRIFVKILVQEMAEAIGISKLKERFETTNEEMVDWYKGMFPKDNVRNTRYAINFFTSIGLGPLTDDLREFLKNAPKLIMEQAKQAALAKQEDDDSSSVSSTSSSSLSSSSSDSSSSSSSYSSSSSSSSSSSDSRRRRRRRRRRRSPSSSSSSTSSRSSYSSSSESSRRRRSSRKRRGRDSPSRSPDRKQGDDAPNRNADDKNRGEDKSRRSKPDDDKRRRRQDSISEERTSRRRPSRSDERRRRRQASTSPEERRGRRRRSDVNDRRDPRSPSSDRDADDRRNRRSRSGSSNRSPPNGHRRRNSRSSSPSERRSRPDDAGDRRRQHDSASPPREEHRRSRSPRRDRRDYKDERRGRRSDERRRRRSRSSSPGRDRRSRRRNDPSRSRSPDSRSSLSEDEGRRGDKRKRRAASDSRSPSSDRDSRKRSSKRSRGFSPR